MAMIIKQSERLNDVQEYYFSQKLAQIRQMEADGRKIINLGIGNPDMMPSKNTIEKLLHSATNPKNHGYQPYRGVPELRQAISKFYKQTYLTELNPETEILPLLGSKEGITHISLAFLNAGDAVVVPDPGYPTYSSVSKMCEAKIITYNLKEKNKWLPDFKELEKLNLKKAKFIWVNYPNMPTGAEATDDCFEKLIAFAKKHRILICHDNPYSMVLNNDKPKSILSYKGAKEVAIELNSLSKSFNMAGWRVGWVAGNKDYIDTILKVKSNVDSGMFLPVQKAAVEALNNPPSWHDKRNEEYKRRRKKVWELLEVIGCDYTLNQVGMFVWGKIKNAKADSKSFVERILQEANVFIAPGFIFGKNGEGYVRISLCSEVNAIQEAITRIKQTTITKQNKMEKSSHKETVFP